MSGISSVPHDQTVRRARRHGEGRTPACVDLVDLSGLADSRKGPDRMPVAGGRRRRMMVWFSALPYTDL